MRKRVLILAGYLGGVGCLLLVTYRTLLAFFSESKAIVLQVNRFGEQYVDLACLVVLWAVCVMGAWYLSRLVFGRTKEVDRGGDDRSIEETPMASFDGIQHVLASESSGVAVGVFGEPFRAATPGFLQVDADDSGDGFSYSVQVIQNGTEQ